MYLLRLQRAKFRKDLLAWDGDIMGVHLYTNGAWTDSGRIYRNSLNLFDGDLIDGYFSDITFRTSTPGSVFKSIRTHLENGTYTFSFTHPVRIVRLIIDNTYTENLAENVTEYTITVSNDVYDVGISFRDEITGTLWDDSPIMLNAGSIALTYEPYNVVDWYTNTGHDYNLGAWD